MAKKFVRGITGVDDVEKLDKTLTNVNDLISDGQNTYIHIKKGKVESYYKLTDGVKNIQSSDNTLTVSKDENGTANLNTNPQKVLLHENLLTDYGISKTTTGNTTKLALEYTNVPSQFDLNTLTGGMVRTWNAINAPINNHWFLVTASRSVDIIFQQAVSIVGSGRYVMYKRYRNNNLWSEWQEQVGDKSVIDGLLAQKQNTITNNTSIGVSGTGLRQLYTQKQSYSHSNGVLKTHVKSVSQNTSVTTAEEEFNFIVKINKGATSASFTLNTHDQTKFTNIMNAYGQANSVRISGLIFTLSGSSLTVTTANSVDHNYVVTFSDII